MTLPAYDSISSVLYVMLLLSNILISMVVATVAYRHRRQPGGLALALLMLAIVVWSFARIFEFTAADIPSKIFWSKVEYIGTVGVPVFPLIFALAFTGQTKWLQFPLILLYWIIPVSALLLAWTNESHQLIWPSFTPIAGTHLIVYGHGLGFWVMIAYHFYYPTPPKCRGKSCACPGRATTRDRPYNGFCRVMSHRLQLSELLSGSAAGAG